MGSDAPFLDTHILIYAFSQDERQWAARLLMKQGFRLSVQSLNEFANVCRRKMLRDWSLIDDALTEIVGLASSIQPLTLAVHTKAFALAERYGFQFYDSALLAAALECDTELFLSEDMPDGMIIEDRMIIRNPFG